MSSKARARAFRLLIVGIVLSVTVTAGAQDLFYDAYNRGLRAFNAGNYAEARQMMERALQLESKQGRRKRFIGMQFADYLPEYYLALISVKEKRYDRAIAYFNNLQNSGLIKPGDREYATLVSERTVAEKGMAGSATPAELTAAKAAPPVEPPKPAPPIVPPPPAPPRETTAAQSGAPVVKELPKPADVRSSASNAPVVAAPVPVPSTAVPPKTTDTAASDFDRLVKDVSRNLDAGQFEQAWEGTKRVAALPGRTEASKTIATRVKDSIVRAGQRRLDENDLGSANRMSDLLARIASGSPESQRFRKLLDDRREQLSLERGALKNLLLGEYQKVVDMTAPVVDTTRASARLVFYAACSRAALSLTSDAQARVGLTTDARRLFERASKGGTSFTSDERYISPEILGLLKQR